MDVQDLSPSTRQQYVRAFGRFVFDTLSDPFEATEDDVVDYLAGIGPRGPARNLSLRALKSFYAWAEDREIVGRDPTRRLKVRKPRAGPAPTLTDEELARLVYCAAVYNPRHAWAILFLYATGARVESACAVKPSDVKGGWVHFTVTKGDHPYAVPLNNTSRAAVAALAPWSNGTLLGVKKGAVWAWIHRAGSDAGFRAHPHLLRHVFGTNVYAASKDPLVTAKLLNHQDLSQIPRYSYVADESRITAMAAVG